MSKKSRVARKKKTCHMNKSTSSTSVKTTVGVNLFKYDE